MLIAEDLVAGDRQNTYGSPRDNHALTAGLWYLYLEARAMNGHAIDGRTVCMLNALQKISRDAFKPKEDNLIDVAGYMRCAQMIAEEDNGPFA